MPRRLHAALSVVLLPLCALQAAEMEDVPTVYAANGRGKGVMCLAGHLKPSLKASSIYLQQCAYALERWKDAFELAGPPYSSYRLAVVTDRFRYDYMVQKDAAFRTFSQEVLDDPMFVDDWKGVPVLRKKPQSSKFQGYPQVWIWKFEAWARSPYEHTLFIDYDIHACKGAERVFDMYGGFDIAPMACEHGCWGGTRFDKMFGAHIAALSDVEKKEYEKRQEPLTAGVLFSGSVLMRQFCLAARDVYIKTMSMPNNPIKHDQPALREILYLWRHKVNQTKINETVGCDIKHANSCGTECAFVHGKMDVTPLKGGRKSIKTWASRAGMAI